jgi:hypothetical protein
MRQLNVPVSVRLSRCFCVVAVFLPFSPTAALENLFKLGPQFFGCLRVSFRLPTAGLLQCFGCEWKHRIFVIELIHVRHGRVVLPENFLEPQGQRSEKVRKLLFRALSHSVTSRVNIPSETRIGKAGRDAPAIRCVHLADECSIAHGRDREALLSRITVGSSTWRRTPGNLRPPSAAVRLQQLLPGSQVAARHVRDGSGDRFAPLDHHGVNQCLICAVTSPGRRTR